jgi:hypothetical protein
METRIIGGMEITGPPEILDQIKIIDLPSHALQRARRGSVPLVPYVILQSAYNKLPSWERIKLGEGSAGVLIIPDELPNSFPFPDGGPLDLGLTRDSELNRTNDLAFFEEQFVSLLDMFEPEPTYTDTRRWHLPTGLILATIAALVAVGLIGLL